MTSMIEMRFTGQESGDCDFIVNDIETHLSGISIPKTIFKMLAGLNFILSGGIRANCLLDNYMVVLKRLKHGLQVSVLQLQDGKAAKTAANQQELMQVTTDLQAFSKSLNKAVKVYL